MTVQRFDKLITFMREHVTPGEVVIAAVSGGPDSMAMLDLLLQDAEAGGYRIEVAHLHHHLRAASDDEWRLVEDYCTAHGVPFHGRHVQVREAAQGRSLEACAHNLRHAALREIVASCGAQWLALAHQADDRAETVLMNILRGTTVQGLATMPPKDGMILRPLLSYTKAELESYCRDAAVPYVIDESNTDTRFLRNRLRHELLPQLATYNPQIVSALNRLAINSTRDADFIRTEGAALHYRAMRFEAAQWTIFARTNLRVHKALLAELVRMSTLRVSDGRGNLSSDMVDSALARIAAGSGRSDLGQGIICEVTSQYVYIGHAPHGDWYRAEDGTWRHDFLEASVTAPKRIQVRPYQTGDKLAMQSCHKQIKKLFQDYGMPPCLRPLWPMLYDTKIKEIIWAPLLALPRKLMYYNSATFLKVAIVFKIAQYKEEFHPKRKRSKELQRRNL